MVRIGTGYDVHRLVPERKLILCGVEVPCELGLLGHSDADVAVHALMDAILCALAIGDIGKLFPDSDPQYKGADSMKLLAEVIRIRRMEGAGFRLGNLDPTITRSARSSQSISPQCRKPRGGVRLRYFAGERKSHH
ncbi:MAG: 2-C-methyl-D-erythritol 2,4-cyclodiphosphate synthase [Oscillospiraceae bacterium]